jgi:hypothetical protein
MVGNLARQLDPDAEYLLLHRGGELILRGENKPKMGSIQKTPDPPPDEKELFAVTWGTWQCSRRQNIILSLV